MSLGKSVAWHICYICFDHWLTQSLSPLNALRVTNHYHYTPQNVPDPYWILPTSAQMISSKHFPMTGVSDVWALVTTCHLCPVCSALTNWLLLTAELLLLPPAGWLGLYWMSPVWFGQSEKMTIEPYHHKTHIKHKNKTSTNKTNMSLCESKSDDQDDSNLFICSDRSPRSQDVLPLWYYSNNET